MFWTFAINKFIRSVKRFTTNTVQASVGFFVYITMLIAEIPKFLHTRPVSFLITSSAKPS